ncbi:DUF4864 domain-containing protein [Shimia abyssi]|uniref:Uncharacterized protein DUF4864 n=1 Tax=Shimia abyssi TaxID=1662395 RepID=A0A2P8F8Z0_9RHOB|nr:DUF4864 domain-containing protein [Shimia abyssi]PSL18132.1 uncharacterized protein DUF4864 [Shimia abyssi]
MKNFMAIMFAVCLGFPGAAQEQHIEDVIRQQMQAFQRDDFDGAFDFASDGIQQFFQTPDNFGNMVRRGYPMVYRPDNVQFLELREVAGNLWQKIIVTDATGVVHFLDYQMLETSEGWRIGAVRLLEALEVGV